MQQSTIESRRHSRIIAGGGEGGSMYGVLLNREREMKKCEKSSPAGLFVGDGVRVYNHLLIYNMGVV